MMLDLFSLLADDSMSSRAACNCEVEESIPMI